jgi:isopentenyl-diphosphate delta-isomerase type 1
MKQERLEPLDIVDKNDNVIGKGSREFVHKSKSWHRVAHVLIFNTNNELLLPVRSKTKSICPNMYDCSISEHVASGESPRTAAVRGLKEELGIGNPKLVLLCKLRADYEDGENNTISILYILKYKLKINIDRHEVYKAKFLQLNTVRKMLIDNQKKFAPWTIELLNWYFHIKSKAEEIK